MSKIIDGVKYTPDHEWIKKISDTEALVGITDFAQGELGELVYIEVSTIGKQVEKGKIFGTVEAVKTTSDLFMPVTGKVVEMNAAIDDTKAGNPGIINDDPYGNGWIIKVEMADPAELDSLLEGSEYAGLIK